MSNAARIIQEVDSLPVEERILIVDTLLRTLNAPDPDIDRKWATLAERRLRDLHSGQVKPVSGEEVFARIQEKFAS